MFIHFNGKIHNANKISSIDCSDFATTGEITIHFTSGCEVVRDAEAIVVITQLCPAVLEGKEAKYHRHAWAVHNIVGHPLMQIFSWLGMAKFGIEIHDLTIPQPIIKTAI
jgi:hypothetical protein